MARITLITTSYPDNAPGSEAAGSFVEDFALELSKRVEVTVLAASAQERRSGTGTLAIRRFSVPRMPLSLLKPHNPFDWPAVIMTLNAGRKALQKAIAEQRPDHILALWALPSGWWAQSSDLPFSVWILGSDVWSLARLPLIRNVLRNVLRTADYRFADGLELCTDAEDICGKPCSFLPSTRKLPSSPKKARSAGPPWKLAFLGRWHPNKGADLLMRALLTLGDDDWKYISEVRFFGGGPLEADVQAAAASLSIAGRPVTVGGYLDKGKAAALLGWADYLMLPSRVESIPVIFSDAMQIGTPLIATPVGDLPRLHDKYEIGILAEAASSAAFAAAIRQATQGPAANYSGELKRARHDFDLTVIAKRFLDEIGIKSK